MKQEINRSRFQRVVVSLLALVFAACADSSGGGGGGGAVTPGGEDDVRVTEYYQDLLSKPVGDCDHVEELQFQALANLQQDQFGTDVDGKKLLVHVLLSLKKDGTYLAVYSEQKVLAESNSHVQYQTLFHQNISGKFRIENDTQLILEGLGVANKLQIGNEKKVQLKIQKRINDPRVNSIFITLAKTLTSIGPDGESAEQYCESQP